MSIASEISRLQGAKADIKTAIEGKGVTVPSATKIDGYASLVSSIPSGGSATLVTKNISANGTYNASSDSADGYSQVNVAVPNTYTAGDEGKVVSSGALVSQTSKNINSNGTHSTVTNNQVVVAVPNSYSQSDEGKVVSNGALVAQTSDTVTQNDTYDTTLINSLTVNVSGGGGLDIVDVLQGDEPSGAVSFKATHDLYARAVSGRRYLTELTVDLSDGYNLRERDAISNNIALQRVILQYNETTQVQSSLYDYGISSNAALKSVIIRGKFRGADQSGLRGNANLELVDVETAPTSGYYAFGSNCFLGSSKLKTLILRQNNVALITQQSFDGSGMASSGATVYVPSALISSYQSASNWSTLYNNGYVTFSALENSVYADIDWYKS